MRVHFWDTAGQERFRSLAQQFFRQAHGMVICFDLTRKDTFFKLRRWFLTV